MSPGRATLADGRYELVRRIGRGASGEVWLADDILLGRQVAIKRADIPEYLGAAEQDRIRRRLEREARAAARLRRPGVAPLFDVHVSEDSVDLVMAYIDAPTLHQLVADQGPLPDPEVARMGLTILSVLEEAHGQGVVHRDIKPSNVLVSDEGVRVTDFGIAAILDETALTRTGTAMGSPSYIAPEQAKGEDPAPAADLWGLGATLYYALTGRAPFDRQRAIATVHAVVNEPHEPVGPAHPLSGLIDRLLAKHPSERPTVAQIRAELERVAATGDANAPAEAEDDASATKVMAAVPPPPPGSEPTVASEPTVVTRTTEPPERTRTAVQDPVREPPPRSDAPSAASPWERRLAILAGALTLVVIGFLVLTSGDPSAELDGVAVDDGAGGASDVAGDDGAPDTAGDDTAGDEAAGGEPQDAAPEAPAQGQADEADRPQEEPVAEDGTAADQPDRDDTDTDTDAGATGDRAIPEGWEVFQGETYSVAHPAGWHVRQASGPRVDLVDPSTGAYLRVDWTDSPEEDPEADWREQSRAFATRHDDYREIRIESVDYQDAAAIWEYLYREGDVRLHAYNLGFVAGDRGYALNFQTPQSEWERMEPMFEDFMRTFRPQ